MEVTETTKRPEPAAVRRSWEGRHGEYHFRAEVLYLDFVIYQVTRGAAGLTLTHPRAAAVLLSDEAALGLAQFVEACEAARKEPARV